MPVRSKLPLDDIYILLTGTLQRGIPVATVAINNSTNAALLAIRILGASNPRLREGMEHYLQNLEGEVMAKVETLDHVGWEAYGKQ
jgi:phosphoribosylaminoimidazole carboxylase